MEVHVPHDVILNHVIPRVPAKSVGRFRCVSKEWHSFLTSKMFQNMHIDHHPNNIKLLVFSKTETPLFEFTTINCEAPPSDNGFTPICLPRFEGITPRRIYILASFHGLVCLGIKEMDDASVYSDLILWNPLTNEYKSSCEDDYKLLAVKIFGDKVYIYSLKSDSRRKVDAFQSTHIIYHGRWSPDTDSGFGWTTTYIKLWKLDEYGNMKEVATYQIRPHGYARHLIPFHLMRNGNWLMRDGWSQNHKIYKVDLKNQKHIKDNIYDKFDEYAEVRVGGKNYTLFDGEATRPRNRVVSNQREILKLDPSDHVSTSVMIRNIPNNYTRKLLVKFLEDHCKTQNEMVGNDEKSAFDFVYLPIDF
nr:hypothetical protein [Tanacetum cinerariifolium]